MFEPEGASATGDSLTEEGNPSASQTFQTRLGLGSFTKSRCSGSSSFEHAELLRINIRGQSIDELASCVGLSIS